MENQTMTTEELVNFLRHISRPQFISLRHSGVPSMVKTDNPFPTLLKHQHVQGLICFNYEDSVNRQMPEGYENFVAGNRRWGARLGETPLVKHRDSYYLEVRVIKELSPPRYTFQGDDVLTEVAEPFLKSKRRTADDSLLRPKDFKIEGITELRIAGGEIKVEHRSDESLNPNN